MEIKNKDEVVEEATTILEVLEEIDRDILGTDLSEMSNFMQGTVDLINAAVTVGTVNAEKAIEYAQAAPEGLNSQLATANVFLVQANTAMSMMETVLDLAQAVDMVQSVTEYSRVFGPNGPDFIVDLGQQ